MHFGFIKDMSEENGGLYAGLDVGTTSVRAVVAEIKRSASDNEDGYADTCNILGTGTAVSRGIKKGVVTNIEHMADSIRAAVREAGIASGVDIRAVHTGITGAHIGCMSSSGVIAVRNGEIGDHEVASVIDAARAVALPFDREILHVIPTGFTVNGSNGISDPRGMCGVRLETRVQIITCATTSMQNLVRSCTRADLDVTDVVFQPLASAEAVLTQDEKNLGVALIDIGGGTTDISLFHDNNLCYASVLGIGGGHFTNDVAVGLRLPARYAESLKLRHGCAILSMVGDSAEIDIDAGQGRGNRRIPKAYLVEIIQPRAEEIFALIKAELQSQGFDRTMNAGVVLTGGSVMMEGLDVMAEHILELPVRIGSLESVEAPSIRAQDQTCLAAAGLALQSARMDSACGYSRGNPGTGRGSGSVRTFMKKLFSRQDA